MSYALALRTHLGRSFLPKALPEHRVDKTTDPKAQALMLVRELIASKFYGLLLVEATVGKEGVQKRVASPEYLFCDELRLHSEFVRDAKGLDQAIDEEMFTLPEIKKLIVQNAALISKIVAASYLLCETDFNTDNLLVLSSGNERFCPFVRIDYDHSLLHPGFFPCDISLGGEHGTLAHYLFNIQPDLDQMDAGFLNWLPTSGSFKAGFKQILVEHHDVANEAAISVFETFGQLKESDIRALVSGLPSSLEEIAGLDEINKMIDLLVLRAQQVNEFLAGQTPASDLSTSIESDDGRSGVHHVATTLSLGSLSTPPSLTAESTPTGMLHSLGLQSSTPLEWSLEA